MVIRAVPMIGKILYRPHLLTTCPEPMEATSSPPINGKRRTPDSMGLMPRTSWKKRGRKVRAPNMANPTTKPMALAERNTEVANRLNGMTGSRARRSARTNATPKTTPATSSPSMNGDDHGYEVPPKLV